MSREAENGERGAWTFRLSARREHGAEEEKSASDYQCVKFVKNVQIPKRRRQKSMIKNHTFFHLYPPIFPITPFFIIAL